MSSVLAEAGALAVAGLAVALILGALMLLVVEDAWRARGEAQTAGVTPLVQASLTPAASPAPVLQERSLAVNTTTRQGLIDQTLYGDWMPVNTSLVEAWMEYDIDTVVALYYARDASGVRYIGGGGILSGTLLIHYTDPSGLLANTSIPFTLPPGAMQRITIDVPPEDIVSISLVLGDPVRGVVQVWP